mgnify:CR=1 FL=1
MKMENLLAWFLVFPHKKILDELEELEEIRAYDKAKKSTDEILPFEEALDKFKREDVWLIQTAYSQQCCKRTSVASRAKL